MTLWIDRKNGEFHKPVIHGKELDEEFGPVSDEGCVMLYAERPDWVRVPDGIEHAGEKLRVLDMYRQNRKCINIACGEGGVKEVTELEHDYVVIACQVCGQYTWANRRFQ